MPTPPNEAEVKVPPDEVNANAWERLEYLLGRIVVRTLRIAAGFALGIVAFYLLAEAYDIASTPFAALTLWKVGVGALAGLSVLWLLPIAFFTAFGAGAPGGLPEHIRKIRKQEQADQLEREKARRIYESKRLRSKLWAILTDSNMGLYGKPGWVVSLIITVLILAIYALLIAHVVLVS